MNRIIKCIALSLILTLAISQVHAQEFNEDGSMKLSEVSTDKKYGYESTYKTAIKVGSIRNEQAYLRSLRGPNGEQLQFEREGSCCEFKCKKAAFGVGFLDKYKITYQGLKKPIYLYINGYEFEDPKCPYGFTIKAEED